MASNLSDPSVSFDAPRFGVRSSPMSQDYSAAWIKAIEEATACLRQREYSQLDSCLACLNKLESVLIARKRHWGRPPSRRPPEISASRELIPSQLWAPPPNNQNASVIVNYNPYSEFETEDSSGDDDDDEGGDEPLLNVFTEDTLDVRRLLIRIRTYQSEVFAARALVCKSDGRWRDGAMEYTFSLQRIHAALELADSEISRWIARGRAPQALAKDADIVEVAIQSLIDGRDRFEAAARQLEKICLRKLQPQWQARDKVKAKMGDRWTSNPSPKLVYARMREETERQLREVTAALALLEQVDTRAAQESSNLLKEKVRRSNTDRYNGKRPTDLSRRVSLLDYPDATEFGWTFTGSSGNAEFFEKDGVKLDWYFTTATIKTSLDHPTQGKTQLFGARVDPETYIKILMNPREHTGKRYQRKSKKNKKSI